MLENKEDRKKRFKGENDKKRFLGAKDINDVGNESLSESEVDDEDNCLLDHQEAYENFKQKKD